MDVLGPKNKSLYTLEILLGTGASWSDDPTHYGAFEGLATGLPPLGGPPTSPSPTKDSVTVAQNNQPVKDFDRWFAKIIDEERKSPRVPR